MTTEAGGKVNLTSFDDLLARETPEFRLAVEQRHAKLLAEMYFTERAAREAAEDRARMAEEGMSIESAFHERERLRAEAAEARESALRSRCEGLEQDAARYRLIRDATPNGLYITRNADHSVNYTTAREWIEEASPEEFADDPADEVERMKATDTIWAVQIYPQTPIGFYKVNGATLDNVVDRLRELLGETTRRDGTGES